MGKKKRPSAASGAARVPLGELVLVKTMTEQEWAYSRRLEHLSYRDMRRLATLPPAQGGLGYDISEQALKSLVAAFRDRMVDVLTEAPELHRDRELNDLDLTQRAIMAQLAKDEANGVRLDPALIREYRATGERRARLLGLDAAAPALEAVAEVDDAATLQELNTALVRLGKKPLEP